MTKDEDRDTTVIPAHIITVPRTNIPQPYGSMHSMVMETGYPEIEDSFIIVSSCEADDSKTIVSSSKSGPPGAQL